MVAAMLYRHKKRESACKHMHSGVMPCCPPVLTYIMATVQFLYEHSYSSECIFMQKRKVKNLYIIFLQNRNGIWQHLLSYKCFIIIAFHHNSYFSPLDTSLRRIISPSDASFPDYYPLTAVIPYSQMACSILSESLFRLAIRTVPHHETACYMHRKRHSL